MGYMKDIDITNMAIQDCAAELDNVCDAANALDRGALEDLVYSLGQVLGQRDDTEDLAMAAYGLAACAYMSDMGIHFNELPEAIEYMRNMLNNMNDDD